MSNHDGCSFCGELFESELPPAVKALDAASKARSGPELRRAVVKSGEPGHEVALVAGQLLAAIASKVQSRRDRAAVPRCRERRRRRTPDQF